MCTVYSREEWEDFSEISVGSNQHGYGSCGAGVNVVDSEAISWNLYVTMLELL